VVDAVQRLNKTMQEVNDTTRTIAAAEEQSMTTGEIARNIADSTEKIMEMNKSVSESALAVQDVNRSIHEVTKLSDEAAADA
jgi:methyl-accepting chemotaxis protein